MKICILGEKPAVAASLAAIVGATKKEDGYYIGNDYIVTYAFGHLVQHIYSYLNCNKPVQRLWISRLTDKAIKDGLQNLKPGCDYDNLYQAAKARSESDFLVGVNSTQSLSVAAGSGVYSLGRVQTPTLAMICKRYLENKNFISTPFWQIKVQTEKSNVSFSAISREKYENKETANEIFQKLKGTGIKVESVEKKEVNQEPPLLYDLTELQKKANIKYGFSADKTLSIAQKIYEMSRHTSRCKVQALYIGLAPCTCRKILLFNIFLFQKFVVILNPNHLWTLSFKM